MPLSLGLDFGTSGVRSCLIDCQSEKILHEQSFAWNSLPAGRVESSASWRDALMAVMEGVPMELRSSVAAVCCSGTSSSALLFDAASGAVSREPRMYNFNVLSASASPGYDAVHGRQALDLIGRACPPGSATNAASSTLAKLLAWHLERPLLPSERLLHQADFIAALLMDALPAPGVSAQSDWHNALKLGFDVHGLQYPDWLHALLTAQGLDPGLLPRVARPGRPLGPLGARFRQMGFSHTPCVVAAGTTDSIAAFLASGADTPGTAVTSLGSTLAVKLLSEQPVSDDTRGIYAHRLGDLWLVGGASNVGCAVLRQLGYSDADLASLSADIDPAVDSPLAAGYYPLPRPGERFPESDPDKEPALSPQPPAVSRVAFLHGLLQSIGAVEARGYAALEALGATRLAEVRTAGGGSKNDVWTAMRQRLLGVPVSRAGNTDAAFGAARLGLGKV